MPIEILGSNHLKNFIEKIIGNINLTSLTDIKDYGGYSPFHVMVDKGFLGSHVDHSRSIKNDFHVANSIFYASPKWNTNYGGETVLFSNNGLKIIKLIEVKTVKSKAKIVNANMPEKIKSFVSENFHKDLKYLEKKYKIKINLLGDKIFLVPEYEISFENKSKKILDKVEHKIEIKKIIPNNKNKTNNVIKFNKKNFKKRKHYKRGKTK